MSDLLFPKAMELLAARQKTRERCQLLMLCIIERNRLAMSRMDDRELHLHYEELATMSDRMQALLQDPLREVGHE